MTMLRYADTKKPMRDRKPRIRFKAPVIDRAILIALSDKEVLQLSQTIGEAYFHMIKDERDRQMREIAQGVARAPV